MCVCVCVRSNVFIFWGSEFTLASLQQSLLQTVIIMVYIRPGPCSVGLANDNGLGLLLPLSPSAKLQRKRYASRVIHSSLRLWPSYREAYLDREWAESDVIVLSSQTESRR